MNTRISIDNLIEIVRTGGKVKTGMDVYSEEGILLLDKDIVLEKPRILEIIKGKGIRSVPVNTALNGGLWDASGRRIKAHSDGLLDVSEEREASELYDPPEETAEIISYPDISSNEIEARLKEIDEIKRRAEKKYKEAKQSVKKVLNDIRDTGGQFDYDEVEIQCV